MIRQGSILTYLALAVSGLALAGSLVAFGARQLVTRTGVAASRAAPAKVALSMVVATFSGQGVVAHRWFPSMMVVREGDTVDLVVANPDRVSHQFESQGLGFKTKILNPGESDRLTFVASQVGVFEFHCALQFDPAKKHCTPDHAEMRGYLIVTK